MVKVISNDTKIKIETSQGTLIGVHNFKCK